MSRSILSVCDLLRHSDVFASKSSAVYVSAVSNSYQVDCILLAVEVVDHAVIANSEPILTAPRKSLMRIVSEAGAELMNLSLDRVADLRRKLEENGIEFARVDLSRATHACSGFRMRTLPSAMSFLPRSMLAEGNVRIQNPGISRTTFDLRARIRFRFLQASVSGPRRDREKDSSAGSRLADHISDLRGAVSTAPSWRLHGDLRLSTAREELQST